MKVLFNDESQRRWHEQLAAATPPNAYAAYNAAAIELEERIQEMRELPNPPKSLKEGLLFLGVITPADKS
jgi:hypothetical protein